MARIQPAGQTLLALVQSMLTPDRLTAVWRRMLNRRTVAPAPSMARSVVVLALGVAVVNVLFSHTDAIFAAANDPWATYANVEPTQSQSAIAAISHTSPMLHGLDAVPVTVALAAKDAGDYLTKPNATHVATEQSKLTESYTVQAGDSLSSIAAKYNLHTASILAANEIPPDPSVINTIQPGATLTIPAEDISDSTQWLDAINAAAQQQQKAAAAAAALAQVQSARSTRVAAASTASSISSAGGSHPHSGTYTYGYCTDLVAALRPDLPSNLGNAGTWVSRARAQGFSTGSTPQVNAAVQLAEGFVGHVAIVTSVNGSTITIRERNYQGWNVDDYRTMSVNSGDIVGYIY